MAAEKTIKFAPQCGDWTVDTVIFHGNNYVENFNYPQSAPAYKQICKFLLNCPLAEAFTKAPSVIYTNLLREFRCTAMVYNPEPPMDNYMARPLKEYKIKFLVMNGKKPLNLDYKTFLKATGLDYNNGACVPHPSPKAAKAELAKIATNATLLNKTLVLGENYFSTEQVNSIQQLLAYCLLIWTMVHIREIIYSDLVTKLTNKSRLKYVSYPRFILCALAELLGALSKMRNKPKSKKTTPEAQVTPPSVPTKGYVKIQSLSSGQTTHPQDSEGTTQPVVKGFHSPPDEGTRVGNPKSIGHF
ncbi:hypothetical protein Tco_0923603 [Tanacetum coccineum]|uniref:Uncharacterized protein n=1 Tax=Tanacetum coccineum TaxID=301880 RepID=A0ABQ5D2D8_9ASTR